jgi:hypothetical protein
MWQGYRKEQKSYLELIDRNEKKEVSIQERKFLNKYSDCRYWSYLDYARDEELAFFRMGVDSDEPLDSEDKPLFPNIVYSYRDDPRLAYWIGNTMLTEHIPATNWWFTKRKARRIMMKKWEKGEKVTYGDMRVMFNPDTTKVHDLEFLMHIFGDHDGLPKDIVEKKLYDTLYPLYSTEITHLAQMMHFPELDKLNMASPRKHLNPLYVAYKQRWFGVNPVKDFEKVFHGVTQDEYQEIVDKQYELLDKKPHGKSKKKPKDKCTKKRIDGLIIATIKQK